MGLGLVQVTVIKIAMDPAEITNPAARIILGINLTPVVKAVGAVVAEAVTAVAVKVVEEGENSLSPYAIGLTVNGTAAGGISPAATVSILLMNGG